MKTLSYVKQALAVALLISAAQASAMNPGEPKASLLSRLGSGVKSVLTAHERGAAWLTHKALGCKDNQSVLAKLEQKKWAGFLVDSPDGAKWDPQHKGVWGVRSVINNVAIHSNKYLWATRVALLAGIAYGIFALYKRYSAKPEEVVAKDNKEDAEPAKVTEEAEVVVTGVTAEPAQPVRSAQSYIHQPR